MDVRGCGIEISRSIRVLHTSMVKRKKPGPPPTGKTPIVPVRLPESITTGVDQWAQLHGVESRSAAIRILLEKALRAELGGGDKGKR
jgi:hypothetical protein